MKFAAFIVVSLVAGAQQPRTPLSRDEKVELLELIEKADAANKILQAAAGKYEARLNELKSAHNANDCSLSRGMAWEMCLNVVKK